MRSRSHAPCLSSSKKVPSVRDGKSVLCDKTLKCILAGGTYDSNSLRITRGSIRSTRGVPKVHKKHSKFTTTFGPHVSTAYCHLNPYSTFRKKKLLLPPTSKFPKMSSGHCPNSIAHGVGPTCTSAPDEEAEEAAPFLPRSAGGGRGVRQPVPEGCSNTSRNGTPWSLAVRPPHPRCFLAHAKTGVTVLFDPAVFFLTDRAPVAQQCSLGIDKEEAMEQLAESQQPTHRCVSILGANCKMCSTIL